MRRHSILLFLLLPFVAYSAGELNPDSLRRVLPSLTGTKRADVLNQLSEHYLWINVDSAGYFAEQALSLSRALGYSDGIDLADFNRGTVVMRAGKYQEAEPLLRQAIDKLRHRDPYHAGWAMCYLGDDLLKMANYQESIKYLNASLPLLRTYPGGDPGKSLTFLGLAYGAIGDYETGLDKAKQSYIERLKMGDKLALGWSYFNLALLYNNVNDFQAAVDHLHLAERAFKTGFEPDFVYASLARSFKRMNRSDSANFYLDKAIKLAPQSQSTRTAIGHFALVDGQYEKAIALFKPDLAKARISNSVENIMAYLGYLASAYQGKNDYQQAVPYAQELYEMARKTGARPRLRDASELLWKSYDHLGETKQAYRYLMEYSALRETLLTNQFKANLFSFKGQIDIDQKQARIELLNKEKIIISQQLRQESLEKWLLVVGLVVVSLLALIGYRAIRLSRQNALLEAQQLNDRLQLEQLEHQHQQDELRRRAEQLEIKALRAQMNPHFIFNCLNSINRYILVNDRMAASNYLTTFSTLIRMVLENSEQSLITLAEELEMLTLYLELERLRFKNAFNFSITFINTVDTNTIRVPPLLLQPFAENAIWHGLMHKDGPGNIDIAFRLDESMLYCIITDDGVGRQQAGTLKMKPAGSRKSLGMQLTADRLALLSSPNQTDTFFDIEDLVDEQGVAKGTKVLLKIPHQKLAISDN
ncbi:tetratricopeptide repeat-containing sensor histidine kinase [Spirosoma foliorum]|uniref:Histidine kinase n=1 Tax=Spirosoma foliorum TaxID=2710596 RepID=A0A7G5GQ44_9BACT|nr:histidine kinase [Spirosoma foliorum]QMW00986.1 histidine kinase [Spirosoma foliorum]